MTLPQNIIDKIKFDSFILNRNERWYDIHEQIKSYTKTPLQVVISKNGTIYRYNLKHYMTKNNLIILPELISGEKFYSANYIYRVFNIDWTNLPFIDINIEDIVILYS